jgi:nucleoside-diphosphate-sugar epimerase
MSLHLHLLGGAGRIGTALIESLTANPLQGVNLIWVYCDSTKAVELEKNKPNGSGDDVRYRGYSAFSPPVLLREGYARDEGKHVVVNLRGINNKVQWLNQPSAALELQIQAIRSLTESDLWMFPGVEIIHLSSQLCDLIESPLSLGQMCEEQESYRRPYMISRLHQEAMLSAYAYQHGISTSLLRLPAVYGFPDDTSSPWVLNSLCRQWRHEGNVDPRNPDRQVYLTHREPLIDYLRGLLRSALHHDNPDTVRYLRPPMLKMTVEALASLVRSHNQITTDSELDDLGTRLIAESTLDSGVLTRHLELLGLTIKGLIQHG